MAEDCKFFMIGDTCVNLSKVLDMSYEGLTETSHFVVVRYIDSVTRIRIESKANYDYTMHQVCVACR